MREIFDEQLIPLFVENFLRLLKNYSYYYSRDL